MISKKKAAKKPTPAKPTKKSAKKAAKKSSKNRRHIVAETTYRTQPATKGSIMTEATVTQTPATSTIEHLLADIANKLGELVQIESYCAQKIAEKYEQQPAAPTAVPAPAAVASIPAAPAPAQAPAAPSSPPSRPGAGTIGGLVWDYCDGLSQQLGAPPTKDQLIAAIKQYSPTFNGQPVNELTASTQYSKWRSAMGLPRLPKGFGAQKPAAAPAAVPAPSAPTIGAPVAQPAPLPATSQPGAPVPPFAMPAAVAPAQPAPLPAASVPSVIAPIATPTPSLPPWLRS